MSIIRDPATMLAMLEGGTFGTKFRAAEKAAATTKLPLFYGSPEA